MSDQPAPTRRRRWPWILLAVVVAIPLAGFVALRAFVNPDALRPRLVAAVQQATGRALTIGEIELGLSLRPTVVLRDVALANAPGGSRPQMLTAGRVEVQAALLPLLSRRIEIARIELDTPDLLLETDPEGRGNWQFRREAAPAEPATPDTPAAPGRPLELDLTALRVADGRLTWRGPGLEETVEITALEASAPHGAPTTARGTLRLRGQDVALQAETAPLAAFGGDAPVPLRATFGVLGAEARLVGEAAPDGAWMAAVEGTVPELARLAPMLPQAAALPPLRDLAFSGRLSGTGGALTGAEALVLRVGAADLAAFRPGLALTRAEATAPRLDAPLTLAVEATQGDIPLRLSGTAGTPALLLAGARAPLPVDLRLEAAGSVTTLRGQIRDPLTLSGIDLAMAAQVPDLAALAPLAGTALPAIRDLRAEARIAERGPGFRDGAVLRGITIAAAPGQARGELTLARGGRPGVTGRLDVARLDLDALRAAVPAAPAPTPAPPAAAPDAPPAPAPARDGRVIPDITLPFAALRGFDADVQLAVASLTSGGVTWSDLRLPLKLQDGRGGIAPFAATGPGGAVTGALTLDAAAATPGIDLTLRAPGLDLAPLQRAFGQPVRVSGRAELDAALRGSGTGLRAIAASLDGHLGLAMLNATLEPPLTAPVIAALRSRIPVPLELPQRLPVECVALRADIAAGVARIGTLLVDAPAAKVAGSGTVNLGTEALALRLLHDVRAAGTTLRVSADLGGTLGNPVYAGVNVADAVGAAAGALAGRVGGDLGQVLGALANRQGARPEPLPQCGPALAAARGGREGPVPAAVPAEAAQPAAQPAPPAPAERPIPGVPPQLQGPASDLLRGLLRR